MNLLDRLQAGLCAYARHVVPDATVVWSRGAYPEAASAPRLIAIRVVSGPTATPAGGNAGRILPVATSARVRCLAGRGPLVLHVSGMRWAYDAPADSTAAQTRDALASRIGNDPPLRGTVSTVGADALRLQGPPGSLFPLKARGQAVIEPEATQLARVTSTDEVARVEFQAYAAETSLRSSASAVTHALRQARRSRSAQRVLDAFGLARIGRPAQPVDLDHMAGPAWASRSVLAMTISAVSVLADPVERLHTVALALRARPSS